MYASHDDALAALRPCSHTDRSGALHLDIRFTGSVDAIRALNEGTLHPLGLSHRGGRGRASRSLAAHLPNRCCSRACTRSSALRGAPGADRCPGNPLGLHSPPDVARTGARFINRPWARAPGAAGRPAGAGKGSWTRRASWALNAMNLAPAIASAVVRGAADGHGHRDGRPCAGWTLSPRWTRLPPGVPERQPGPASHAGASGPAAPRVAGAPGDACRAAAWHGGQVLAMSNVAVVVFTRNQRVLCAWEENLIAAILIA